MENYPGVWSLPSIQYEPAELPDPFDLDAASRIFARMSAERFGSATIRVEEWLTAGRSDENPMQRMVELVLYRISIDGALALNPRYYTDCGWLKRPDFKIRTMLTPLPCGLCTRLWEAHEDSL
ncbi:MAG: hypothetical protein KBD06_01820 [Candidatus Pacebacteria bacterium]|nr:hypothetical protein [Candidatus Paceibacterota bacterium]